MDGIRNIVWILTDSQHADAVGYMGNRAVNTPNLDRLAEGSRIFTNACCQSPICVPSRESFITGRYPSDVGILHNRHRHASNAETLGHKFRNAGFKTCFSGKSHFIADNLLFSEHDMERGFERYADWDDYLLYLRGKGFFDRIDRSKVREGCYEGDPRQMKEIEGGANRCFSVYAQEYEGELPDEYTVERCAYERASDWLDTNHDQPFFLFLSLYRPHGPFPVPKDVMRPTAEDLPDLEWSEQDLATTPSLRQRIAFMNQAEGNAYNGNLELASEYATNPALSREPDRSREVNSYTKFRLDYYRSISYVDQYVGKMLEKLEALGHSDDTMIVFTSDHGDMLGEHGLNLKMCFYEASIRVPLLIRIPGLWDAGELEDRPVMLLDLVPTIAGQLGVSTEDELPGLDLTRDAYTHERPVFSEIVTSFGADVAQYGVENHIRMVKTDQWKYISKAYGEPELFNLVEDPGENNNLGGDPGHQEVRSMLQELIGANPGRFNPQDTSVVEKGAPK